MNTLLDFADTAESEFSMIVDTVRKIPLTESEELKRIQLVQKMESVAVKYTKLAASMTDLTICEKETIADHVQTRKKHAMELEKLLENLSEPTQPTQPAQPAQQSQQSQQSQPAQKDSADSSWSQVVKGKKPRKLIRKPAKAHDSRNYIGSALIQKPRIPEVEKKIEIFPGFQVAGVYIAKPEDCLDPDNLGLLCKLHGSAPFKGMYFALSGIVNPMNILNVRTSDQTPHLFLEYDPAYMDYGTYYRPQEVFTEKHHKHRILTSVAEYIPKHEDPGRRTCIYRASDCDNFETDVQSLTSPEARLVCDIGDHYGGVAFLTRAFFSTRE